MLELSFAVGPDEYQVINGIELAQTMIVNAARLIAPYVANCPACIDTVFGAVANEVLAQIHENIRAGNDVGFSYVIGLEGEARNAALQSHFADSRELVESLLADGDDHHD